MALSVVPDAEPLDPDAEIRKAIVAKAMNGARDCDLQREFDKSRQQIRSILKGVKRPKIKGHTNVRVSDAPSKPEQAKQAKRVEPPKREPWISHGINTGTLWLIALAFGIVGLALNVQFYFSCGHDWISSYLLAALGGGNDLATMTLPTRALLLWERRRPVSVFLCCCAFLVCLAVSVIAGISFSSGNLGDAVQASTQVIEHREALKEEKASIEKSLATIKDWRLPPTKQQTKLEDRLHVIVGEIAGLAPVSSRSAGEKVSRILSGKIAPGTIDSFLVVVLALLPALGGLLLLFARR